MVRPLESPWCGDAKVVPIAGFLVFGSKVAQFGMISANGNFEAVISSSSPCTGSTWMLGRRVGVDFVRRWDEDLPGRAELVRLRGMGNTYLDGWLG
jgi:hypothetical protein